jgi:hypothetical protein
MNLFKLFSRRDNQVMLRGDALYIQASSPKVFIKNTSDIVDATPISDQVAQVQFLDRKGRIESLFSCFHSRKGAHGLKLSLRSKAGNSDGVRLMLLDTKRRQMILASRPPIVSRDSEVATADYVREMILRSRKSVIMIVKGGVASTVEIEGLIPRNSYRIGIMFLVAKVDPVDSYEMAFQFQAVNQFSMNCNVDMPGVQYFEQLVETDVTGSIRVSLIRSIPDFTAQILIEASLA